MTTDNKSSILVDELLPEFLETEGPKFKSFVRAYYEFLETTGQLTERSKNLLNYADIDRTDTEFVKYFDREILANFPQEILTNKKLVAARIKELYRAKGSEQAYKMLFRMLFDDEIEFYYPGDDILRVSDGRWVQENSIRLSAPFTGNLFTVGGRDVVGLSSGATATVERVVKTFEQGTEVFEIFIANVRGVFEDTEVVQTSDGSLSGVIIGSIGPLQGVIVNFGGSSHRVGDIVSFDSISGIGGRGVVQQVDDSSVIPVIIDGGSGFTVDAIVTLTGGSGLGAQFQVDTISDTEVLFGYDDTIAGLENTVIEDDPFGSSSSGTISANLAISTSNTVLSAALGTTNIVVGTISAMSAITRGSGFTENELPTVQVIEPAIAEQFLGDGSGGIKGFNASVIPQLIGGSIVTVGVNVAGAGYARVDPLTIINLTRSAQNAIGSVLISGIIEYNGKYTDTKGFLSWNNKLQDNFYYQQFSYVIRSQQNVDTYRETVKKLLHPAGTNLFGDFLIQSNASVFFSTDTLLTRDIEFVFPGTITATTSVDINNELIHNIDYTSIISTLSIPNHQLSITIDDINIPVTPVFGIGELIHIIDPVSIASTTVVNQDKELVFIIDYTTKTSTLSIPDPSLTVTIDDVNVPTSTTTGNNELVHIIDPVSIASTAVVNTDKELVYIIDYTTKTSTLSIPNHELLLAVADINVPVNTIIGVPDVLNVVDCASIISTLSIPNHDLSITIDEVNVPTSTVIANIEFVHIIDPVSIASTAVVNTDKELVYIIDYTTQTSTLSIPNHELLLTIDEVNVPTSTAIANIEFVHIIDPVSIASTAVVNTDKELVYIIDYTTKTSTLSIPNHELLLAVADINVPTSTTIGDNQPIHVIDPVSIASTAVVNTDKELVYIIDYTTQTSTLSIPNHELSMTVDDVNVPATSIVAQPDVLKDIIDIPSIVSTLLIPNHELLLTISDINIPTSTLISSVTGLFEQGDGTITNFFVNTIEDLSTEQIAKYGGLTINSVPGNRIFEGTGTAFTTQIASGASIVVIDVNNTDEEITLIIDIVNSDNILSVTANVTYSNSSLAIVNNAIYLIPSSALNPRILRPSSIASTAVVNTNKELVYIIDYTAKTSTLSIPEPIVLYLGNGTVANFFVNTIEDLSTEQIAKYGNLTINSAAVPGNKIFEGLGTIFTTQLVAGSTIVVIDINDTDQEFTLIIDSINDDNTLSVTSNVVYSNSSLAIVNNAIFLYS